MDQSENKQRVEGDVELHDDVAVGSRLWAVARKLYGVGELIKFWNGEPCLKQEDCHYGVGTILTELADEVDSIRNKVEN